MNWYAISTCVCYLVAVGLIWPLRRVLEHTTLTSAWWLALLGAATVTFGSGLLLFPGILSVDWTSALHCVATTLLVVPFVDVLGARNPGHRAWPWFVVLPLVLVFQWPVASQLWSGQHDVSMEIPAPMAIGFMLVVVMGVGNYFGTRNTLATSLMTAAIILSLLPVTQWGDWPPHGGMVIAAVLVLASAMLVRTTFAELLVRFRYPMDIQKASSPRVDDAAPTSKHAGDTASSFGSLDSGRLWVDFRDLFGIVWAKRVMDRFNQFAQRESWDVELTLDGFVIRRMDANLSGDGTTSAGFQSQVSDRSEEILVWLLRRFVSSSFIDHYRSNNDTFDKL